MHSQTRCPTWSFLPLRNQLPGCPASLQSLAWAGCADPQEAAPGPSSSAGGPSVTELTHRESVTRACTYTGTRAHTPTHAQRHLHKHIGYLQYCRHRHPPGACRDPPRHPLVHIQTLPSRHQESQTQAPRVAKQQPYPLHPCQARPAQGTAVNTPPPELRPLMQLGQVTSSRRLVGHHWA